MGISKKRNPKIAEFFERLGIMDKMGSGIRRMENEMEKHGLSKPSFDVGNNSIKITLKNPKNKKDIKRSPFGKEISYEGLNERQKEFLFHLQDKGSPLSRGDYVSITDAARRTASRDLNDLLDRGIVTRIGKKRGTKYILT